MTVIAKHLKCDCKDFGVGCVPSMWLPNTDRRTYYSCPRCKRDYLCDNVFIQEFQTDKDGMQYMLRKCPKCRVEVTEKKWSKID